MIPKTLGLYQACVQGFYIENSKTLETWKQLTILNKWRDIFIIKMTAIPNESVESNIQSNFHQYSIICMHWLFVHIDKFILKFI